jgi:hypothetical protein
LTSCGEKSSASGERSEAHVLSGTTVGFSVESPTGWVETNHPAGGTEEEAAMMWTNRLPTCFRDWPSVRVSALEKMGAIRGTIQRVDYRRRELRVIAQGRVWRFVVTVDCQLSFNDTPAILRCFHSFDPVTIVFRSEDEENVAIAIHSQEGK